MSRLSRRLATSSAAVAGYTVRWLPGLAALGCAVAGVLIKWGVGWGLLAAVPFLLLLDRRT